MHNIAVIIPKYGLVGGAEQFAAELTEKITFHADYNINVLANRWQNSSAAINFNKVPIISFPKFLTTISFAYFVQRQIKQHNYSMVHSHERIFKADIFTMHGIPHRYWIRKIRRKHMSLFDVATAWVENKLVREGNCKKFISVSNLAKNIFLQEYPMAAEKVIVIHPGVNLSDYKKINHQSTRSNIRKYYSIFKDEPVMMFASMNFEIKGLDAVINALGCLATQGKKVKLLVVGKGKISKYIRMAQKAGIADHVIFAGQLGKQDLIQHYLASDIYIMLSQFDTFGMVVLEAMAAGLPVIISSNVGARDIVSDGKNGFIIEDISNDSDIANKINLLLDKNTRHHMSDSALETAARNQWTQVAAKYQEIYDDIIAEKERFMGNHA